MTSGAGHFTQEGHLLGMLDRDIRTAKMFIARNETHQDSSSACGVRCDHRKTRRSSGHPRRFLRRLGNVLIFGVYLSLFHIPGVASAPTLRMDDRERSPPKWVNPCNINMSEGAYPDNCETQPTESMQQIQRIVNQAKGVLDREMPVIREYVQTVFNAEDIVQHHDRFKGVRYSWLPSKEQIPKDLFKEVSAEHLDTLELNRALLDTYEYLQRIAVGLEQMAWDEKDRNGPFAARFNESEYRLKSVLCEIQEAIFERCLEMRPDITRDVMPDSLRSVDDTQTGVRNWVILRDYINALEYVQQVFKKF